MEGIKIGDGWEFPNTPSSEVRTVVLVGRTGNGKSATGNSILGKKAFTSKNSSGGVTTTCQLRRTLLEDGKILNVIDTPGLFDSSLESEFIDKEIVRCIDMVNDGIHAVLVVFSVRFRFSQEQNDAIESLRKLFGTKITNYMIVVFTGGDDLEDNSDTLNDYLDRDCPEPLKDLLKMCGNRCVLFDNRTKDESKKFEQLKELVALVDAVVEANGGKPYTNVDAVVEANGGKPYTNELFVELKKGAVELRNQTVEMNSKEGCSKQEISQLQEQFHKAHEEQLQKITEMAESKLKEANSRLEQQLAVEQKGAVEMNSKEGCSKQEISQLQEQFHKAHEEQLQKITEMDIEHGFNEQSPTLFGEKLKRIAAFVFYAVLLFYFFESNEGRAAEEKST